MKKKEHKDIEMFSDSCKFKVRVSGIIIHEDRILVESFDDKVFLFPGGHLEVDEKTKDAIKRELEAEIQKNIKVIKLLGIAENFYVNNKSEYTHCLEFYYLSTISIDNYNDFSTYEVDRGFNYNHNYKWIKITELNNYNVKPKYVVNKVINNDLENIFHIVIN